MALNNLGLGFLFTAKDLASGVMTRVKHNLGEVEGAATGMGAAAKSAFSGFGVGMVAMGAGIAALAALGPAIEESKNLSKAIALVATESDEATFPQERMRDLAEKLAVQYGKMPVEQAQAMYKAVALGANDAGKAQDFLNGVNLLAVAGDADLITTTNALGGVLNAYGESFDKATSYGESFFTAMRMGNTTVQDLSSSIGRVAPTAKNLNISFDELIGAVSVMTNKGIQASEAVSGIKEALANIIHPSSAATAEASRLGVKFTAAALRAKGSFQAFIGDIVKSPKFTADSFSKLFTSVEGSAAVINIASNAGKDYAAVLDAMKGKAGSTQKGFEIMAATLDYQEKKFAANKAVVLGMIGKALEPMAAAVLRVANAVMGAFSKLPKPVIAFASKLFVAASAFLAVVGAGVAVKAILMVVGGTIASVAGAVISALLPVIVVIGAVALAFYVLRTAYEKNLGGFGDFVRNVYRKVKLAFDALVQVFSSGAFSGAVMDDLNKAENSGIKSFVIKVFLWANRIQNFLSGFADGFSKGIEGAAPAFSGLVAQLEHLGIALGFISEKADAATNASRWAAFGKAGAMAGKILAKGIEIGITVITVVIGAVAYLIDAFTAVGHAVSAVAAWISNAWATVKAGVVGVASAISGAFSSAYEAVASRVRRIVAVIGLVADIVGIIFGAIGAKIGAFFAPAVTAVSSVFDTIVSGIKAAVMDVFQSIAGPVMMGIGVLSAGWNMLGGIVSNALASVASVVVPVFDSIVSTVSSAIGQVAGFISGVWTSVWNKAAEIVTSIIEKIRAAIGKIGGFITGAVGGALSALGVKAEVSGKVDQIYSVMGDANPRSGLPWHDPGKVDQIHSVMGGAPPPIAASTAPLLAAPSMSPAGAPGMPGAPPVDLGQTNTHLATIAQKIGKAPHVNVFINGKQADESGGRFFSPAPIPT